MDSFWLTLVAVSIGEVELERANGGLEAEISDLTGEERRVVFRGLKTEVTRVFCQLDPPTRFHWASSARKLLEMLGFFESDPQDTFAFSMEQAVELACEFIKQADSRAARDEVRIRLH